MADIDLTNKPMQEEQTINGLTNGISNGTSESEEHKDHRHKSKDRERDKHRDKDRHKSSHKDKDRDKDRHSSHKSSHKDKERDREREKGKDRDRQREKEKSGRDKDKDKERNREKDAKHKERSDKDKERREKDGEKSDRHKDKEKSRDRDKDRHRSDKERSSSHSKERSHSTHKSSHKDKHRDKEREKAKSTPVKEEPFEESEIKMETDAEVVSNEFQSPPPEDQYQPDILSSQPLKEEVDEGDFRLVIKEEYLEEDHTEEDDVPLASRKRIKVEEEDPDDDDDKPLMARKKVSSGKKRKKVDDDEDEDFKPIKKKVKKEREKVKKSKVKLENKNIESSSVESPTKGRKKKQEEENVWRWWEEEKRDDGKKWTFLEHKGPVFPDTYIRLPGHIKFLYNGEHMHLSELAEETAGFYARMLDNDYTTKEVFNKNFFKDWRKTMTSKEREKITDVSKCNFKQMHAYFVQQNEDRKNRTKEEKKVLKEKNEAVIAEYGWCNIDGHKQRIGNFKIEPPGLFRGRGEHPKQGMVKKRIVPEEVIINCSKDSAIPVPPQGHKWKEVRHDQAVTWLACWNENIQGSTKYVMLNAASKLKGEKDWQKYQSARRLHKHVDRIRNSYRLDWKSKEMRIRQRGVALYFIDKLALRAGNEKDEDQADTVGCCSLRVEHVTLHEQKDGKEFVVEFDFLGKDSIRYYNVVPVEKRVFKNLQLFVENKQGGDDIFDRLNTQILNKYLNELLDGLTAKVFRTYNASRTLQEQLEKITQKDDPVPAQVLTYNRANREVAILCNHQRAVPKTFDQSMANLQKKMDEKIEVIHAAERELKDLKKAAKHGGTVKEKVMYDKKKKAVDRLKEQLKKLEISATDKEENKQIALGTSKLNYLDPRITVAWCKKNNIPVDKVFNKTHRQKFQWAIDMATADFDFLEMEENDKSFKNGKEDDGEDEDDENADE